ncbi:hypothetical protein [Luedemannella helvata]|uniref:Uncharacterized protein n=1 Tax=Luedemannella helvata TaxID=349315 RepID=A0ABP4X763_9ACTN
MTPGPEVPDSADSAPAQRRRRRVRHAPDEAPPPPVPAPPPPVQRTSAMPRRVSSPRPGRVSGPRPVAGPAIAQTRGTADGDGPVDEHVRWHHEAAHGETVSERGLRGLVGGGATQVNVRAAMRARDATRPRAADMARAEAELTIVRRYWTPRETTLPQEGSGGSS